MSRTRVLIRGLAASLTLAVLLVGLPAGLVALGRPRLPSSWAQLVAALLRPDDGTLAVAAIQILAWLVWAILAAATAIEVIARVRHLRPPRLPMLGWPQLALRDLVAAAALIFVAAPALGQPTPASAEPVAARIVTPAHLPSLPKAPVATTDAEQDATYVVARGDTLWSIAERHLGSGHRYGEIVRANRDLLGREPGFIKVGWRLRLPEGPDKPNRPKASHRTYTVKGGDTLSQIAQDHLGNAHLYPRIAKASRDITQPGGRHLTDPDEIDIGWTLHIPTGTGKPRTNKPADTRTASPDGVRPTSTTPTTAPTSGAATPVPAPAPASAPADASTVAPAIPAPPPVLVEPDPTRSPAAHATQTAGEISHAPETAPSWLLTGLTGAGLLLAGSTLTWLTHARHAQLRARRPGHTVVPPPPQLAPVEKSVRLLGPLGQEYIERVTLALATLELTDEGMPRINTIEVSGAVTLHLAEPADLPHPWHGTADRLHWTLPHDTIETLTPPELGTSAPYPCLAAVGAGDDGNVWLLNLEQLGTLSISGEPDLCDDLARGIAAELALDPWARNTNLDCVGTCSEIPALNPGRAHHHDQPAAVGEVLSETVRWNDRLAGTHRRDMPTARRAEDEDDDLWESRALILTTAHLDDTARALIRLVNDQPGRNGTAVVLVGDPTPVAAHHLTVTDQGRLRLPTLGLDLVVGGVTSDEAQGMALLVAQSDDHTPQAIGVDQNAQDGWRALTNQAGALRDHLTQARHQPIEVTEPAPYLILDAPDEDYLAVAATTSDDLAALSPRVPAHVAEVVSDADPALDEDLALWFAGDQLPRLWVMGPLAARTGTAGQPGAISRRRAHSIELLAYLAMNPHGVTTGEVAEAFHIPPDQVRKDLTVLRSWLGTNPRTARPHLPEASQSRSAQQRGINAYQLDDVLVDADLFRRLRVRGESRGPAGLADLQTALSLVTGEPFSKMRPHGGSWLYEGERHDQNLLCAIVDVAHIVATAALHAGELAIARTAAETARNAAPYEETPRLDLAEVLTAEGHHDEAERLIRDEVCNRSDYEDGTPTEIPERTDQLIEDRQWLRRRRAAG